MVNVLNKKDNYSFYKPVIISFNGEELENILRASACGSNNQVFICDCYGKCLSYTQVHTGNCQ